MLELKIFYSKDFEIERIKKTLLKLDWYKKHNYSPSIPFEAKLDNLKEIVNKEFIEEEYSSAKKRLLEEFSKELIEKLEKKIERKLPEKIEIYLTKYGMAGSYNPPNIVIINFKKSKNLINCLKHELIHILIEEEIHKKGFNQKEKEKIVEEIMFKIQ